MSLKDRIKGQVLAMDAAVRPWAASGRLNAGLYEFLLFGLKQAWASLFAAGEKPTGSRDPFGLRRSAQGVLKILVDLESVCVIGTRPTLGRMPGWGYPTGTRR